jgi:galactokinase
LYGEGVELPPALTAVIRSRIPIAAGTSSSSAFADAWTAALLHGAGREAEARDPQTVARIAHRAEVIEFKESGGMMDQLSIAHGGVCRFEFTESPPRVTPLKARPEGFVLGDSLQPKDTQASLSRVRGAAEGAAEKMRDKMPGFDYMTASLEEAGEPATKYLNEEERKVLLGNLRNREILREGFDLLSEERFDVEKLGALLTEHHGLLRDNLGISTPRVEAMMDAALDAGALGGKINGSGGGGCMFVLAPGREAEAAAAMEKAGGKAYPVPVSDGITIR